MVITPQQRAQCVTWYAKFSSVVNTLRAFRRQYKEEDIRQAMMQSPRQSLSRLSAEQNKPYTTCHRIVRPYLNMRPYRSQRMHALTQLNYEARLNSVTMMCERHQGEDQWLKLSMFTDEATFHVSS